jgi:hypothetical protein
MPLPKLVLTTGAVLLIAAAAQAADRSLGTFRDWSTMAFGDAKDLTCMAFAQPTRSEGDYTRRGDVFVFVSNRPRDGERNRLSVETGYTYDGKSPVTLTIDDGTFKLRSDGSTAWLADPSEGEALIRAMKAGRLMQVVGTSSKGTVTTDDYSLLGFTAAARAIDENCR